MLSIDDILKLSEEMGVKIEDSTSGKHYILNENGEAVEFSTDMLMGGKTKGFSYGINSEIFEVNLELSGGSYNFPNITNSEGITAIPVTNSIIDAA